MGKPMILMPGQMSPEQVQKLLLATIAEKTNLQKAYVRPQDQVAIGVEIQGLQTDLELLEHLRRQDNSAPIVSIPF